MALLIGAPVAISIGIFLALLAPAGVRNVISPLVEMLAAIPSVILGFWGVIIFGPFVAGTIEPFLHKRLGFIPLFGAPQTTGASIFTAGLILTIMVIPIIASVSRDLFMAVPRELQDGAAALGSTRWEVIRGVVLPTTLSGMIAASLLGLGRALGEAIAVSQVVGAATESHVSLFKTGGTLASIIALQFPSADLGLHDASLYYCAALLLVIGVAANLLASWVGHALRRRRGGDAMSGRTQAPGGVRPDPAAGGDRQPAPPPLRQPVRPGRWRSPPPSPRSAVLVIVVYRRRQPRHQGDQLGLHHQGRTGRDRPEPGRHRRSSSASAP